MKKLSELIVLRRYWTLGVMVLLAVVCLFLYLQVNVNYDMTKYLPGDSPMKQGMDVMEEAFPAMGTDKTIRVMSEGLDAERQAELLEKLKAIPYVGSVAHDGSEKYQRGTYSLFVISTPYEYGTPEEVSIENALASDFREYGIIHRNDNPDVDALPVWMLLSAVALLIFILTMMCKSWFEPLLFLVNIGIAVVLNEGTNIILGEVSYITSSISAVLQLVLSIDYSIMLMNRYRQERQGGLDKVGAMTAAVRNCFASVGGSALTTAAGLLALAFMRFRIGMDLGFVLAKGVVISLVCSLTVLPGLGVLGDLMISRTAKKTIHIPMDRLARFSFRRRYALTAVFAACLVVFCILQGNTRIAYVLAKQDPIAEIFPPENMVVVVYENRDEEQIAELSDRLEAHEDVTRVVGYPNLFGKAYSADGLAGVLESFGSSMGGGEISIDPSMLSMVYSLRFAGSSVPPEEQKMTIPELFSYVRDSLMGNPLVAGMLSPEIRERMDGAGEMLDSGMEMLKTGRWSRMILYTSLPLESERTDAFMAMLTEEGEKLSGEYYLIGNSAMTYEMRHSFSGELLSITLLTAAAIFLIVMITSRSFAVPALLVLVVQCGVFITVTVVGWQGYSIYYLALLMVECILMGATIDYGILFTGYYRENRKRLDVPGSMKAAYSLSIHSISTSGLIIVIVTAVFGAAYPDPTIAEICRTLSTGSLSAILVILFLLPAMLAAFDRWIAGGKQRKKTG